MIGREKKWWAWQGLNLRPLRCQHSAYRAKARKSANSDFRRGGTGREQVVNRGTGYRSFTARPPAFDMDAGRQ